MATLRGLFSRGVQSGLGKVRALGKDIAGVTAIEFAMLFIPFFGVLMMIFANGYTMFVSSELEEATAQVGRDIETGIIQTDATITTATQLRDTYLCPKLNIFVNCKAILIDSRVLPNFASANPSSIFQANASADKLLFCTGTGSSTVMLNALYPMPSFFPIRVNTSNSFFGAVGLSNVGLTSYTDGSGNTSMAHLLLGTTVFRNEPFGAKQSTQKC
ncbi:MAG: pilus assembly protein [Hyphomicrobiales bacterium]|nr:pilus assembly protein [Hyphomicrobiales bacterium]